MRKLLGLIPLVVATLTIAVAAKGAAPDHEILNFSYAYTDTDTCGFPIAVQTEFTNIIIDKAQATGTGMLQLHQRDVEAWTANGVTLNVKGSYTIFVGIVDGVPQTSKHVGLLDFVLGPKGDHLFFRTGMALYQVVFDPASGFYVDGPLLERHGVRADFDAQKICAAFS